MIFTKFEILKSKHQNSCSSQCSDMWRFSTNSWVKQCEQNSFCSNYHWDNMKEILTLHKAVYVWKIGYFRNSGAAEWLWYNNTI